MKKKGRKKSLDEKQSDKAKLQYLSGISVSDILNSNGISLSTFYRYKSMWELKVLNVAVEATQGRYFKNYLDRESYGTDIENFEFTLICQLANALGYKVKFWPYSFKRIVENEINDHIDIAVSWLADTKERRTKFLFSKPYVTHRNHQVQLYGAKGLEVNSKREIEGLRVGVIDGTIHAKYLCQKYGEGVSIRKYKSSKQLVKAYKSESIDLVMIHEGHTGHFDDLDRPPVRIGKPIVHKVNTCIAIREGHNLLQEKIDEFIYASFRNGCFESLYKRFLKSTSY